MFASKRASRVAKRTTNHFGFRSINGRATRARPCNDEVRPGAYANGTASNNIDYMRSPKLFTKLQGGGIFRMGVWSGGNGMLLPHYDTIHKAEDAASDHAAIAGEFNL